MKGFNKVGQPQKSLVQRRVVQNICEQSILLKITAPFSGELRYYNNAKILALQVMVMEFITFQNLV